MSTYFFSLSDCASILPHFVRIVSINLGRRFAKSFRTSKWTYSRHQVYYWEAKKIVIPIFRVVKFQTVRIRRRHSHGWRWPNGRFVLPKKFEGIQLLVCRRHHQWSRIQSRLTYFMLMLLLPGVKIRGQRELVLLLTMIFFFAFYCLSVFWDNRNECSKITNLNDYNWSLVLAPLLL